MSGRKRTQISVEDRVRESLRLGLAAHDLAADAEAHVSALAQYAEQVPEVRSMVAAASATVATVRRRIATIAEELSAKNWFRRLSLERIQALSRELDDLRQHLEAVAAECRAGHAQVARLLDVKTLVRQIDTCADELRPWVAGDWDVLQAEVGTLSEQANEALTGNVSSSFTPLEPLARRLAELRERASRYRVQDQERRFVLAALGQVCLGLGYEVQSVAPAWPTDDLVVDVNTFSHGVIRFRLQLDGVIRSESTMMTLSCDARFEAVEDKLRELGIVSAFHYEEDGRPVRRQRGAKSLPDQSGVSATRRAGGV